MKIHNVPQISPEWFELRRGRMTSSHAQAIASNGKGLETYILSLMAETYSSAEKEQFSNEDLERGIELEDQAREIYSLENNVEVEQVGFIELDEFVGGSPDGLVGDDGMIEIKCPKDVVHFKMILGGEKEIDSKYRWQILMNLLITGRKWCDFISYSANFKKSSLIFRITPDSKKFDFLKKGFEAGSRRIQEIKQAVSESF